jgi:hypothetical protein
LLQARIAGADVWHLAVPIRSSHDGKHEHSLRGVIVFQRYFDVPAMTRLVASR